MEIISLSLMDAVCEYADLNILYNLNYTMFSCFKHLKFNCTALKELRFKVAKYLLPIQLTTLQILQF